MVSADAAPPGSAKAILNATADADRRRIAHGERPLYHALWAMSIDGSVDVTIRELPLIHVFVPDDAGVLAGARLLIARTVAVDPESFDVRDGGPSGKR